MNDTLTRTDFQARFEALLSRLAADDLMGYGFIDVPSDGKPWLDTGIDLSTGERVTTFAVGKTYLKDTDLWFGADFQLWCRIGPDGEIFRGTRMSNTFTAQEPGRLYLASYFPGEWATRTGAMATPDEVYEQASGCLTALIVRWRDEPIEGLKRLAALGDVDGLIASEIDRLTDPVVPPHGWNYPWFVGPAEVYRSCRTPEKPSAICCHTHRDVGLLQKDISLPLEPNTCLRWAWRMDRLPSEVREDTLATHDYLSIAVEFDNGQDITYYWSAELPVGTAYRCPIPTWTARETHVAIRSGREGLGEWFSEERDVHRDYLDFIGGTPPARIIKVWLIALSMFQGREGDCQYSGIEFVTKEGVTPIE